MAILGLIFTTSYSGPVKEIQSIEEYSAQVLGDEEEDAEDTSQTIVMPKVKKVEKKEEIKKEQLDYLKEHEQKVIDLVKAQNSKVESVQIDWDQTQWSDGGLTTPEYYMNVFGRINHIEESGWGVDIPINEDNTLNLDEMYIGSDIRVGGRLFE